MNINFMIHRHSEWIMLNLGESIFSLLIIDVPNEGNAFYTTFYCSILTVIFLHVLHFRSQPLHADHHAWRRSKDAGYYFFVLTHGYTLGLVSLGAAYTFFLLEADNDSVVTEAADDNEARYLVQQQQQILLNEGSNESRWLAAASTDSNDNDDNQIARLYCITLALIFASLDLMTICHLGIKECEDRCYCPKTRYNIKGYILICCRVALILITATMDQWEQNVRNLSIAGLLLVLAQLALRKLGAMYLGKRRQQIHSVDQTCTTKPKIDDIDSKNNDNPNDDGNENTALTIAP
jgi:hypothetical protein